MYTLRLKYITITCDKYNICDLKLSIYKQHNAYFYGG